MFLFTFRNGIPITLLLNRKKLNKKNSIEEINELIRETESDMRRIETIMRETEAIMRENENTMKILNIIETRKRHGRRHGRRHGKNKI